MFGTAEEAALLLPSSCCGTHCCVSQLLTVSAALSLCEMLVCAALMLVVPVLVIVRLTLLKDLHYMCHWLHTAKDTLLHWLRDSCCHYSASWSGLMVCKWILDLFWSTESCLFPPFNLYFPSVKRKYQSSYWDSLLERTLVPSFFRPTLCVLESRIRNSVTYPLMWFGIGLPVWGLSHFLCDKAPRGRWQATQVKGPCVLVWWLPFTYGWGLFSCFELLKCAYHSGDDCYQNLVKEASSFRVKGCPLYNFSF